MWINSSPDVCLHERMFRYLVSEGSLINLILETHARFGVVFAREVSMRLNLVQCNGCGSTMAGGILAKHKDSKACKAAALSKELRSNGWNLTGKSRKRLFGLGLVERHETGFNGAIQWWSPRWALDMLTNGATDEQIAAKATELGL